MSSPTYVGTTFNDALGLSTQITATRTTTAGNKLVSVGTCDKGGGATDISSISGSNGDTFTKREDQTATADNELAQMWECTSSAGGTNVVYTATFNASADGRSVLVNEDSGAAAGAGAHASQAENTPGTGADAVNSTTATPTASTDNLGIGFMFDSHWATGAPAAGTGWTSQATGWNFNVGHVTIRVQTKTVSASGSAYESLATAGANESHISFIMIYSAAGGGGATPGRFFYAAGM